jgi:hypothetical protein
MFRFLLRVRALNRLGLTSPIRVMFLVIFVGALIAGVAYACVVFNVLNERSHSPNVHAHSTR